MSYWERLAFVALVIATIGAWGFAALGFAVGDLNDDSEVWAIVALAFSGCACAAGAWELIA